MLNILVRWLILAVVIIFIAWLVPGISVDNFTTAMLACVVIGLINAFIRPVVEFVSLPVNFLTLGLFSFVINALLLMLAGYVTPGFQVDGFLSALLGSIVLSLLSPVVDNIGRK